MERQKAEIYPMMAGRDVPDGWPDRLIVSRGTRFAEMKKGDKWPSDKQEERITYLLRNEALVYLVHLFEDETASIREGQLLHDELSWKVIAVTVPFRRVLSVFWENEK